ncbi:MAG: hypothetical protein K7J46_03080 [Bryobacter sp.]|nr:hypothetical protein [Bryobacter sp. CoA8 C33]
MSSKYPQTPMDLSGLKTVSIYSRGGKVQIEHFAQPPSPGDSASRLLDKLPRLLAADTLRSVVTALREARRRGKPVIWGMGGHVIKCGLAPVLIEMMNRGFITAFAMNGSTSIHDFEIAISGATSEDVEAVLPDGSFGSAEETGRWMNEAASEALTAGTGLGEAYGAKLDAVGKPDLRDQSVLYSAWRRSVPVTVHLALGTDTPHTHPAASGAALGAGTHHDFRLLCSLVSAMGEGGVYVNCGSAVVLPEVFLKVVSSVRNLGVKLENFTTVNFDFLQHYRPKMNVVERPHAKAGGKGYALTGHHEIMVPLLAAILFEGD